MSRAIRCCFRMLIYTDDAAGQTGIKEDPHSRAWQTLQAGMESDLAIMHSLTALDCPTDSNEPNA